jgi:hypothetical protein
MALAPDPWRFVADQFDPPINPWLHDPAGWVMAKLDEFLWSKQIEIAQALHDHRKVAVRACHGPGKSYLGGRIICWWLDVHPQGTAFAVSTAPSDQQVKAILWREITRAHRRGQLAGRVTLDAQWKTEDGELIGYGRKPADHDEHGFQGIHARYVLVVLDEACGIPKTLWTGTSTLVTNDDARILAIGNPDDPTSEFAEVCAGAPEDGSSGMSKAGWWVIGISVFETPNFTGEHVPEGLRHLLPSQVWVEERRVEWGEGSPLWTSKVLGRFPDDGEDGVIPWSWLKRCQGEAATAKIGPLRVPIHLGVDVGASEGGDETVIVCRRGGRIDPGFRRLRTADSEEIVDGIIAAIKETEATAVMVDSIGVGFGVCGSLRRRVQAEVQWPVNVTGINVGEAAEDPTRFVNRRAEIWWTVGREWSQSGAWDLTDVGDSTLNELATPRYIEVKGRIQIESKDDIRKRLGRSPDNADAVLLACCEPEPERAVTQKKWTDNRLKGRR